MLAVALLVCWHSYSSSEEVYGSTTNAASDGLNWVMTNVLPAYTGLAVNGVVYQYTALKEREDEMLVHVQNENAQGAGYIFRESDDWSGLPGNTISKVIPVPYIGAGNWGNGSIEVEGIGEVVDANVVYTYRYDDTCVVNPQANPNCPDYVQRLPEQEEYEVTEADVLQDEMDRQQTFRDEEQEQRDFEAVKHKEKKKIQLQELEAMMGLLTLNDMQGPAEILHGQMVALNYLSPQYSMVLPDTVYEETLTIDGGELPDNTLARNQYARQLLHQEMVNMQYEEK